MTPTARRLVGLPVILVILPIVSILAPPAAGQDISTLPADWHLSHAILIGTVDSVLDPVRFMLADQTVVRTDPMTDFSGIAGLMDLHPGDLVQVEGEWESDGGDVFLASKVKLLQAVAEPSTVSGKIALLVPPIGFVLSNGTSAQVRQDTQYVNLAGYHELAVGDLVVVTGTIDTWSWTMKVDVLERVDSSSGDYVALEGLVDAVVVPDRIMLEQGLSVLVDDNTGLEGFDAIADLLPGDVLWVEARSTDQAGVLHGLWLTLLQRGAVPVAFRATVDTVDPAEGMFTTLEGQIVHLQPDTELLGLSGIEDLAPGFVVWVEGTTSGNSYEVSASLVELLDDGDDDDGGNGLEIPLVGTVEALVPPASLVLGGEWTIVTDDDTQWLGVLTGYGDLVLGMTLEVLARWNADGTLSALTVADLDPVGGGVFKLAGTVADARPDSNRFMLEGGEWILIDANTPLDGDVDEPAEIVVGFFLEAECVVTGTGDYLALSAFVTGIDDRYDWAFPTEGTGATEALVVLAADSNPEEVAGRHGATLGGQLPGTLVHLFVWDAPITEDAFRLLAEDTDVEDVEPNFDFQDPEADFEDPEAVRRRMIAVDRFPSSEEYTKQAAVTTMGLEQSHARTAGRNTLVAVIDTGIDPFHPLLRHRIAEGGWDYVDDDSGPWETRDGLNQDDDEEVDEAAGHGTFVAGLVLLAAPAASILPYRVLDDDGHGTTFAICRAVLAAMDRGADVINMSFAYQHRSRVLDRLLDEASDRGAVLIAGAGNSETDELPFPARDRRVLAVAAVTAEGELAEFSNHGDSVTIAAPGVDLYSGGVEGEFGIWSGTSMAAPLVSGTVALLRSVNPHLTPDQLKAALTQSALPLAGDAMGVAGMLQVDAALDLVPTVP